MELPHTLNLRTFKELNFGIIDQEPLCVGLDYNFYLRLMSGLIK